MAPNQELAGLMVALITPFTDDALQINEASLQEQVNRLINAGVHGLVPSGSTGECMSLTLAERKQLTELTIKYTAGRVPVLPGVGCITTKDAIELATHANQAGATALMVVPPFYESCTIEQLHQHLDAISKTAPIPIVFYNVPGVSGLSLTPDDLAKLSQFGVKYIKDTSGNGSALTELLFLHEDVTTFNGWDTLTFYSLAAGAKGAIWGAPNIVPELCVALWNALAVKKDLVQARQLWQKILPICQFLESHNYTCAVKTAVALLGYTTGPLRKPFTHIEGAARDQLIKLLNTAGLKTVP